jgi:cell wall-associated NlpC family hydrolase
MMRRRVVILTIATAVTLITLWTPLAALAAPTGDNAARTALRQLGTPYVYGAASPAGFDSSGLTMWVFAQLGVSLPHNANAQTEPGTAVARKGLRPGDLVFFGSPAHHAGIYVGNGRFVHAPYTGTVVCIARLKSMTDFSGGRRLLPAPAGRRPTGRYVAIVARWLVTAAPGDGGIDPAKSDAARFVKRAYGLLGVCLPVALADQYALERGQAIANDELRKGDLVFFGPSPESLRGVGVYVGHANMAALADGVMAIAPLPEDALSGRRLLRATY